jgi:hypothetical protein
MSEKSLFSYPSKNRDEPSERTSEIARGERLLNGYNTNPLVVLRKNVQKKSDIARHTDLIISHTRLCLRLLSFLISASIVAVLAHVVGVYTATKNDMVTLDKGPDQRRVWPPWLRTKPTVLLLGVAATATVFSLAFLLAMFSRAVRMVLFSLL